MKQTLNHIQMKMTHMNYEVVDENMAVQRVDYLRTQRNQAMKKEIVPRLEL